MSVDDAEALEALFRGSRGDVLMVDVAGQMAFPNPLQEILDFPASPEA